MVNNSEKVLDEGIIKYVKGKQNMIPSYVIEFEEQMSICRKITTDIIHDRKVAYTRREIEIYDKWATGPFGAAEDVHVRHWFHSDEKVPASSYASIAKLMGVIPFYPCVMINISPAWKGMFRVNDFNDKMMIKRFKNTIESYLNETLGEDKPRYSRWKYCLESGSDGKFLHAHIVAEINPKVSASMKTHINKGNHVQQLKKYWDKNFEGYAKGALKGKFSIQRILINVDEILQDKLKYLIEENKMEGHQNKENLGLVFGGF